jgi:hypothetical protein
MTAMGKSSMRVGLARKAVPISSGATGRSEVQAIYICLTRNFGANVPEKQVDECGWNQQSKETIY